MTNSPIRTIRLAHKLFEGPLPISAWTPPARAGVYCILVPDARCVPPYRPVFFGSSDNFAERGFPSARSGRASWLDIADYELSIHIAVHWMPHSSLESRQAVERELIRFCQPELNEIFRGRSVAIQ
ncbi:MAG TPA: hypothetical protein VFK84_08175 [Burkholderiales bacterium]|nr:hypothetical protein [Burkholderiales bacterium]